MPRYKENEYIVQNEYCILRVTSKKYGEFDFLIDKNSIEKCKLYHWHVSKYYGECKGDYYYASANMENKRKVGLHRYLMDAPKGKVVDHINGNTLDNRLENLQICSICENNRKQQKRPDNKSGVVGVHWYTRTNKWMAFIKINGKRKHLGYFENFEDAVKSRKDAEEKYFEGYNPID